MLNNIILNENQEYIVKAAVDWYKNQSSELFQFDGEAGTGKSVVLYNIKHRLGLSDDEVLPIAYTGQAAMVMRTKGFSNAVTCHSGLYYANYSEIKDDNGNVIMDEQFGVPKMKWQFYPRDLRGDGIKLIIVDEAPMVPDYIKYVIDKSGIKTIATGDMGQLPPVKAKSAYLQDGYIYHLTELMRQSKESPLIYIAHRARNGGSIDIGSYNGIVDVIYDDELTDDMLKKANIVICGKNKTRDYFNVKIREQIYGINSDAPIYNDRMICRKNNRFIENDGIFLSNGLVGSVVKPPSIDTYSKNNTYMIDFLPDLGKIPFKDIECDYIYLKSPTDKKLLLKGSPYSKGEKFEFAYASTCHLAQGSEYDSGVYIEEFLNNSIQAKLNYTAITRFKKKLIYVKRRKRFF